MKAGFIGSAFTLAIAASSVPLTLGLAGLSKPMWLSLICRKVRPLGCACASPMMPSERGTPPPIVHRTPAPAQVMHLSTWRRRARDYRDRPSRSLRLAQQGTAEETGRRGGLFPGYFPG